MDEDTGGEPTDRPRLRGIDQLDLSPGSYTIVPSEWRRDAGEQLSNITSGTGEDGEATWHLQDVQNAAGDTVLEVVDDRRAMEGTLSTSGQQFLLRSPEGEELMAFERGGAMRGAGATLRALDTDAVLASWEQSFPVFGSWTLADPDGTQVATAKRSWSLMNLMYPAHVLKTPDGTEFGRFEIRQKGLFLSVDVTLETASVPTEVALAMVYGVCWATSDL